MSTHSLNPQEELANVQHKVLILCLPEPFPSIPTLSQAHIKPQVQI